MEKDSDEMITISVPVVWARAHAKAGAEMSIAKACKDALAVRKSPYERWRENHVNYPDEAELRRTCYEDHAQLMAAAPQLLDALIEVRRILIVHGHIGVAEHQTEPAIRAALPDDVAAYVLGEES